MTTDHSTLVETLHSGPKRHGQVRTNYTFNDGTVGDVYRAVLLAIAQPPPSLSVTYAEMLQRIQSVCVGKAPQGSAVEQACQQISALAQRRHLDQPAALEWDNQTMSIGDPYFLFYLRSSRKLRQLAGTQPAT